MKIRDLLDPAKPCFSFEFFPPKTPAGETQLWEAFEDLRSLSPGYVSVTYGAGGSTRDRTVELVSRIKERTGLEAMAHLTCVGHSREELERVLDRLTAARIENILALRGDPPQGVTAYEPVPQGFRYASELVPLVREKGFSVACAGYPEGHPETPSREADLLNLKTKVDRGCDFIVTQLFLDNAFYFDFVERAKRVGITVPIVPGIMPITNYAQIQRMTRMCGATLPRRLELELEKVKDDQEAVMQLGVAHATVQCVELLARGVPGIHFYTLNRSPASRMIVSALRARHAG